MRGTFIDDRLAAIAGLAPDELARRIEQIAPVAAWLVDRGRLGQRSFSANQEPSRRTLAAVLADEDVMVLILQLLDSASLQLVVLLAAHGGSLDPAAVEREMEPLPEHDRRRIIRRLADQFVIHEPTPGAPIALRPGIAPLVSAPGRSLDRLLLDQSITSDDVAAWARQLGISPVPTKKNDRIAAVRSVIGDPALLPRVVAELDVGARELFEQLTDAGGNGLHTDRLGINVWQLQPSGAHAHRHAPRLPPGTEAARQLLHHGLAWLDRERHTIGIWLEALTVTNGRTFTRWPIEFEPTLRPLDEPAEPGSATLSSVEVLVQHVVVQPIAGLKTGGIGVKAIRDLAKATGRPAGEVNTLVRIAIAVGLVVRHFVPVGRGRTASIDYRFEVDPARLHQWRASPPTTRWIELVAAWIDGLDTEPEQRVLAGLVRRTLVADLLELPDGNGVARDELGAWVRTRHALAQYVDTDEMADDLMLLGLCERHGPCGVSAVARTLLVSPTELDRIMPVVDAGIVVQADFSVIAPPGIDPSVRARLDRLSITESTGSVTVLRLDRERIGAAIAAGETPETLLDFLAEHATVALPPTIEHLLRDAQRQQGGLTVAAVATVVTADDVLGLADAVKVKAAKLTLVAPTVATSPLPPAKVMALLRAKGLAPRSTAVAPEPARPTSGGPVRSPAPIRRPVPDVVHPDRACLAARIETW